MKKLFSIALTLLIASTSSFAASDEHVDFSAVEKTVRKALPNTKITAIQPAPVKGLVEIVAGNNVLYADPTGQYLVVGSIYDMHTATDLTAARKSEATLSSQKRISWDSLPLDTAVKYSGSGTQKLAVFFDPDCPWCKKFHDQLSALKDVEVYAIMYPVEGLHPNAKSKAAAILCSSDPLKSLDAVMSGKALPDNADPTCLSKTTTAISQVEVFARDNNIHGTPTLVAPDGRVRPGYIQAEQLKAWLNAAKQG
ncbi:MAG: DsbC family protein [Gammaproteobacteria bacterium]|nr:DsbC family protein [Gammaproteobacteria bacterium]